MTGGFAGFIADHRGDPGERPDPLTRALHAPDTPDPEPRDSDEVAASLLARGYGPGMLSHLAERLADTEAKLAEERKRLEDGRRRQEQIRRAHNNGQITAFDIARMDLDEGDEGRVVVLERRAASLRGQLADAQALVSGPLQRDRDPVEAASRRAHKAFTEATRAAMTEAAAGRFRPRARRPFAVRSAGDDEPPDCADCRAVGASAQESFLLHSDPWPPDADAPPPAPDNEATDSRAVRAGERRFPPYSELAGPSITRVLGYDDNGVPGNHWTEICR